jgi:S1-C subfamily serine protease
MKSLCLNTSLFCLLLIFTGGCASVSMLPENADAVSFGKAEGKTGWSQYAQEESFRNYSEEQIYEASKAALGMAGFSLRKANLAEGYVIGEHGMTMHDWNVIAGIYFKSIEEKIKLKVIIEGSKDIGFSGDVTSDGWSGKIVLYLRQYLNSLPSDSVNKSDKTKSYGTGFSVSGDGLIITAYHVVKDAKNIRVNLGGKWTNAEILKKSISNDIALLSVESEIDNYLSIASDDKYQIGNDVYTLGYPAKSLLGGDAKYTNGSISSLSGLQGEDSLFQISVPIQPGNSGGPLLDKNGEVLGMITSSAAVEYFYNSTGTLPQNINWAVKGTYIKVLLPPLPTSPTSLDIQDALNAVHQVEVTH